MKRLLITGQDGFVGRRLLDWFPTSPWAGRVEPIAASARFDLRDAASVAREIASAKPDWILHLAALSVVADSFLDPAGTLEVNVVGTARLLHALRSAGFEGRLLFVSSADVYGRVAPQTLPLTELALLNPTSPYAVSKAAAEMLCRQWREAHGIDLVIARPFNHVGAGQRSEFALSGFARAIAEIRLGMRAPELRVGNLAATRDFSHVIDICEGYLTLLEAGRAGETYNLCSGQERVVGEVLEQMLVRASCHARIVVDPARLRPADNPRMVGDPGKALRELGWRARRDLDDALAEMVEFWMREQST